MATVPAWNNRSTNGASLFCFLSPTSFPKCLLLTIPNMDPAGKEKMNVVFRVLSNLRVGLEMRYHSLKTGIVFICLFIVFSFLLDSSHSGPMFCFLLFYFFNVHSTVRHKRYSINITWMDKFIRFFSKLLSKIYNAILVN